MERAGNDNYCWYVTGYYLLFVSSPRAGWWAAEKESAKDHPISMHFPHLVLLIDERALESGQERERGRRVGGEWEESRRRAVRAGRTSQKQAALAEQVRLE